MQISKRFLLLPFLLVISLLSSGFSCSSIQRTQVAQAGQDASTVIKGFQISEINTYIAGKQCLAQPIYQSVTPDSSAPRPACIVISDEDHVFIQQSLVTVAKSGKTLDSCIRSTTSNLGTIACVNAAIATIDQLNNDGALHIKSVQARTDYQLAMIGTKTALSVITTILGGKQ